MSTSQFDDLARYFRQDTLELTILPTEGCNLRCKYCYVDHDPGKMPAEVVSSIKKLLRKRAPDLRYLRIGWFGGEPLVQKDILLDISGYAYALSREYPDINFQGGMSTNATLLDIDTATSLVGMNINAFQVSFDGPQPYHDKLRTRVNGRGSFRSIWKNLLAMKQSDLAFTVILRVHLSHDNITLIPEFLDHISDTFGEDERFQVFFKALAPLSGSDNGIDYFSTAEQEEVRSWLSGLLNERLPQSEASRKDGDYVCYAARPTSLVIRPDGSLIKCTIGLDDEVNQIGRLLPDGTLQIKQENFRKWIAGTAGMDKEFMRCPRHGIKEEAPA